jgi:ribonuclease BN (tRNA processing enzyme)
MIETNGCIYLIDAGAPVVDKLLRLGKRIEDLKGIFLTHYHGDHCDGLLPLLGLTNWAWQDASYDIFATEQVIINSFTACSEATSGGMDKKRIRFHLAKEGVVFEDENVKIVYFITHHCDPHPCYSILVECEGKKVFFSGDLSVNLEEKDYPLYVTEEETDLMFLELAHFDLDTVSPYLMKTKAKKIYFNHANVDWEKQVEECALAGEFPFEVVIAKDLDEATL